MAYNLSRSYDENRNVLIKTLFCIHRSVASILELWSMKYKDKSLIDSKELAKVESPFSLFTFVVRLIYWAYRVIHF